MVEFAKLLVNTGSAKLGAPTVICTMLVEVVCGDALINWVLVAVFCRIVPAGGMTAPAGDATANIAPKKTSSPNLE
jgi:hypothetical protein